MTALDLYSPAVLTRTVNRLDKQPPLFLLNTFFTNEQFSENERIYFDVEKIRPRIAPFVAPHMPGRVMEEIGYDTKDFAPAYVKEVSLLNPKAALKRRMGEALNGPLSPAQRQAMRLNDALDDHVLSLNRREEVMAAEILRTGQVVVSGDGFPTTTVNFGRDASLTVTLTGNDRWSVNDPASDPNTDVETMSGLTMGLGGGATSTVVCEPTAWQAWRTRLAQRGELPPLGQFPRTSGSQFEVGPLLGEKVQYIGRIGAFEVFTYQDTYIDDAGASQLMMPLGTVIGASAANLEGTRCYGVIEDEEAGIRSERFFSKSWLEHNPGRRWVLTQSAPLVVPYRPNASWCLKVF